MFFFLSGRKKNDDENTHKLQKQILLQAKNCVIALSFGTQIVWRNL